MAIPVSEVRQKEKETVKKVLNWEARRSLLIKLIGAGGGRNSLIYVLKAESSPKITNRLRWPPGFWPELYWEEAFWQINFLFLFFPYALQWSAKIILWWRTLKLRKCHVCPIATLSELPLSTGTWTVTLHISVEPVRPLVHTDKSTYQSHEQLLLIILLFKERYQPRL